MSESSPMGKRLWCAKGGSNGENELRFLDLGRVEAWAGDYSHCRDFEQIKTELRTRRPSMPEKRVSNYAGQFHALLHRMAAGDLIVLPLKTTKKVAIGVVGAKVGYDKEAARGEGGNFREVEWRETEIDRSLFGQDLLNSFGSFMTFCEIKKNAAPDRVRMVLIKGRDPRLPGGPGPEVEEEGQEAIADLVQAARDRIIALINARFKGHGFTGLVEAILVARGYDVEKSPPGADGGIDLVAVPKPWDERSQTLVVQVKSGGRIGHGEIQKLRGNRDLTGASVALFVSWEGYKQGVKAKAVKDAVKMRLWDSEDVIRELEETYERLPDDFRVQLPMVRVWVPIDSASESTD